MDQPALFISDTDGQAVDLGFDGKFGGLADQPFFHAAEEILELLFAVGVVQTLHPDGMGHGAKRVEGGATDLAGGGVFVGELGMGSF